MKIIHVSDFHFQVGRSEGHQVVLAALLADIAEQISGNKIDDIRFAFTGDAVQSGADSKQYDALLAELGGGLARIGIPKDRILCVPGNHDISREYVSTNIIIHEGIISQLHDEASTNNFLAKNPGPLTEKFESYAAFELKLANFGVGESGLGAGHDLGDGIGVYCLNSALFSSAGLTDARGGPIIDKGRLAVETRSLHSWLQTTNYSLKILAMHHPTSWLSDWALSEIRTIIRKGFQLVLTGHTHDQSSYVSYDESGVTVECSAPPLYTSKSELLGYAIVHISQEGDVEQIQYRQWTKYQKFVAGVSFSNNDSGCVKVSGSRTDSNVELLSGLPVREEFLKERLNRSLRHFSAQPLVWVNPVLSRQSEQERDADSREIIGAIDLLELQGSCRVVSPPQFGLTCLAHHLILEAWMRGRKIWVYLDANSTKPHRAAIEEAISQELALRRHLHSTVDTILVDSVRSSSKDSQKLVTRVCELYPDIRVIYMRTDDGFDFAARETEGRTRSFTNLFLWSLPRTQVRQVVVGYMDVKPIGDEDAITSKVVLDLEAMNIHRTPLNCLTLLKISELDFDESPVNRTEMIKRVLFLLFNTDRIPTYKTKPDLKDCEYVLGYLCERLLRNRQNSFARDYFISSLQECCRDRMIDLDVHYVFDVLHENKIIIGKAGQFEFRFSYWPYYFAAQRMHHNKEFAEFIYSDNRYAQYPAIIEFYTGIDRRRDDALQILARDIRTACDEFEAALALPPDLNIFGSATWKSSEAAREQMHREVSEGIQISNLPAALKDQYADRAYDRARPYNQEVQHILSQHSLVCLIQIMRAGARALRNSDYSDPEIKRILLQEIVRSWDQISRVLVIVLPVLAKDGFATYGGITYVLAGNFGETLSDRFANILMEIPSNVVGYYKDDLFSGKMGPLLLDYVETCKSDVRLHLLEVLLIKARPNGWRDEVHRYISTVQRNSFYLLDVYHRLRAQYRYGFASPSTLKEIEFLIRMCVTKHLTGVKEPGVKLVNSMKDKIVGADVVPKRGEAT